MPGVNVTISNVNGDSSTGRMPLYSPLESWHDGFTCQDCFVRPDAARTSGGSWKDTTMFANETIPHSVSVTFNGTAAYVYCIIDDIPTTFTTRTDLRFFIDGDQVGTYVHEPTGTTQGGYIYDVPVYINTTLDNREHTLVISTNSDFDSSLLLFDRVEYASEATETSPQALTTVAPSATASPSASASNSSVPILPIAVGVTLALVFLLILAVLGVVLRNKQHTRARMNQELSPSFLDMGRGNPSGPTAPQMAYNARSIASSTPMMYSNPAYPTPSYSTLEYSTPTYPTPSYGSPAMPVVYHTQSQTSESEAPTSPQNRRGPPSIMSDATTASFYPASDMFVPPTQEPVPPMPVPSAMVLQRTYDPATRTFT